MWGFLSFVHVLRFFTDCWQIANRRRGAKYTCSMMSHRGGRVLFSSTSVFRSIELRLVILWVYFTSNWCRIVRATELWDWMLCFELIIIVKETSQVKVLEESTRPPLMSHQRGYVRDGYYIRGFLIWMMQWLC